MICTRCGKIFYKENIPHGSVQLGFPTADIHKNNFDSDAASTVSDIVTKYPDGFIFCPDCSKAFLQWADSALTQSYKEQIKDLTDEVRDYLDRIEELIERNKELESIEDQMIDEKNELEKLLDDRKREIFILKDSGQKIKSDKEKLVRENCELKKKLNSSKTETDALKDALHDLEVEKYNINHELNDITKRYNDCIDDVRAVILEELKDAEAEDIKKFIVHAVNCALGNCDTDGDDDVPFGPCGKHAKRDH